jgi:hypothetical protein
LPDADVVARVMPVPAVRIVVDRRPQRGRRSRDRRAYIVQGDPVHPHGSRVPEEPALCPAKYRPGREAEDQALERQPRPARHLENGDAGRRQHPDELAQVSAGEPRRQVLEHEAAEHHVDAAGFDEREVRRLVQHEPDPAAGAVEPLIQLAGLRQHARGDVEADHLVDVVSQCLRETSDATAEIERPRPPGGETEAREFAERAVHFAAAEGEEGVDVPLPAPRAGRDVYRPERILLTQAGPLAPQPVEAHQ